MLLYFFFFFKQKTAYEMRISDWSSDVCSSDLLGPGEAGDGADLILAVAHAVAIFLDARKFGQIVRRDRHAFRLAFQNLAQHLTRQPRDPALQRAEARLASVIADQVAQTFVGQLELAGLEAVRLHQLGEQESVVSGKGV